MRTYAGDLIISYGDDEEDGEPERTKDFSYAMLCNAHPSWKAYPDWKGHPFENAENTPWHPALAAMLSSIGIDPACLQEATLDQFDAITVKFIVRRNQDGEPIESDEGLRLPENHPAITGENSPLIFNDPQSICAVMFWDIGQANVIMLPPDGHTLFQFNDPTSEPPITCNLPRLPDAKVHSLAKRIENGMEDAPLLCDLIDFGGHDIGTIPIRRIKQGSVSTTIEMD